MLRNSILAIDDEALRDKLLFVFTAILPRASKRYQWSRQRPLNAQNQTSYIAPIFYEWNVTQEERARTEEVGGRTSDKLLGGARYPEPVGLRNALWNWSGLGQQLLDRVDLAEDLAGVTQSCTLIGGGAPRRQWSSASRTAVT
jgi:hypothetical protein